MARDYRWPEVHGNLLQLGFSLLRAKGGEMIQTMQIGAFDGQICDPLNDILGNSSVTAVLVEPQKAPYESMVNRYSANPRIRIINAAIAESDGEVTLYVPSAEASAMASLIPNHHKRFGKNELREVRVPSLTAASLVKKCGIKKIDILQLDTEGMDFQILKWFFMAGVEPDVLNFESMHLGKSDRLAARDLLREKGYWWIDTEQDTFAFKESLVRLDHL